jgi:hypothetical protein
MSSLAGQRWSDLEAIVVLQNATEEMRTEASDIVRRQPWSGTSRYKIVSIDIPDGQDGRSALLNVGLKHASGRYLAFLDDDDIVYEDGYSILIQQLIEGGRAIAVGGCCVTTMKYETDRWCVTARQSSSDFFFGGRSRLDLFRGNFIPIHSYVVDKGRIGSFDLYFDESFPPLEDYDFLLRLCAVFEPDFSKIDHAVCEYRIREDRSNSIPYGAGAAPEVIAAHERARRLISERKRSLVCALPVMELAETAGRLDELENRVAALQGQVAELEAFGRKVRESVVFRLHHWLKCRTRDEGPGWL